MARPARFLDRLCEEQRQGPVREQVAASPQLTQIATKAASEQSSPNREKRPRKLGEATKRTSALGMSNANELTYSFNAEGWGQCSARKSQIFALASSSARSFSVGTVRAACRTRFASRRYSFGLFLSVVLPVLAIGFCWSVMLPV
jgi:hypothetical protein